MSRNLDAHGVYAYMGETDDGGEEITGVGVHVRRRELAGIEATYVADDGQAGEYVRLSLSEDASSGLSGFSRATLFIDIEQAAEIVAALARALADGADHSKRKGD